MRRAWLLGGAVAAISALATLLLVEVVLHALDIPRERVSHQRLFVEYDSIRGWRNRPNTVGHLSTDEYSQELRYNSRGLRGPEVPYEKPDGVHRVLLLGDSFVDAYTEALENRVSARLEAMLNESGGRRTEVLALGVGGYSTDQELLWLESEGLQYQPDVVVLLFYANDIWYNGVDRYWRGGKPKYDLVGDSLALTNVPLPRPDSSQVAGEAGARGLNAWIRRNSKLYWLVARVIQTQPRLYGFAVRLGLAEPSPELVFDAKRGDVIAGEFSVFRKDPPAEVNAAWRITEALTRRMRDVTTVAGATFMAFHVPIRSRIYTQTDDIRTNAGGSDDLIDADAVTRRFQQMCMDSKLHCIEPSAAFILAADSLRATNQRLYYRFDWHWNANGHALAAQILADELRTHVATQ
jgi:lysophospholipase L1-like esterase